MNNCRLSMSQQVPGENNMSSSVPASSLSISNEPQWQYEETNVAYSQENRAQNGGMSTEDHQNISSVDSEESSGVVTDDTQTPTSTEDDAMSATKERRELQTPDIEDVQSIQDDYEALPVLDGQVDEYLKHENDEQDPNNLQIVTPNPTVMCITEQTEESSVVIHTSQATADLQTVTYVLVGDKFLTIENPNLIPHAAVTEGNDQPTANSQPRSYFDESIYKRLFSNNILHQARTEIGLMTGDLIKSIITTYGKRAFDNIFDNDEIKAGSSSGKPTKSMEENCPTQGYDKDKLFLNAAFVAWLISKPVHLTMEDFKTYAEERVKSYNTGLDNDQLKYFKSNIAFRYACDRRNVLCGGKREPKKRKSGETGESASTAKKQRVSNENFE